MISLCSLARRIFKLNPDGTRQTAADGSFLYTYDSDDIMSYARGNNVGEQWEDPSWDEDDDRLELDPGASPLREKLCAPGPSGACTYPGKVVLDENLAYDSPALRSLGEFANSINEVRTVRVAGGAAPVFYEYVRAPCVHRNFFPGAKKIIGGGSGGISSSGEVAESLCADPRAIHAAGSCCAEGSAAARHFCNYAGERLNFASAVEKCMAHGRGHCDPHAWAGGDACTDAQTYSWS